MSSSGRTPQTRVSAERWAQLSPLIDAALALTSEERPAYIERTCTGDPQLRAELDRLLAECERGDSLIDRAAAERFSILLAEDVERVPEVLGDRFVVEREIGRGGMATVYLAHDRKHDRPVAIKVLRQEVAASVGADRFLREIRTAARLQHPHIMALHDSGESDGFLYYVMPYAAGETLRDRLNRERQLPLAEALRITRDVASALDHAHSNDIVHRDIKPDNIFLSGGHALVMDFGIARAFSQSAGEDSITFAGFAVGTPSYMSPEQGAAERTIDGRADVYALGCVLYEMLSGHPPFLGTTSQEVLARHSVDPVPRLRPSRPDVPEFVEGAICKAMEKAPVARFSTATAFANACELTDPPRAARRINPLLWALPAALFLAAVGFTSLRALRSQTDPAPSATAAAAPSVAVLAFKNIGRDSTNEALSDGMSEEIAATIGKIPGLRVKAPRSSFSLKTSELSIPEIGSALNVQYLVDGSLQKDGNRLRVRVALLAATNDSTLWTTEYDRPLGDVFAMQDEIARAIASELSVKLAPATSARLSRRSTGSAEAHELYLRGRFFFQRRDSLSLRKAREYFQLAIGRDSSYALAYTGLSDTYSHSSAFGYSPPNRAMPIARGYVDRALALDSTLVEAHSSRAFIATVYEWDWPRAGREFREAVALDPLHPSARLWRAWYLMAIDSVAAGIREGEQALAIEPFLLLSNTRLVSFLYYGRRYREALQQAQKTLELDSTYFQIEIERARVLVELKRCDEALDALSRAPRLTGSMFQGVRGYTYARCGRRAEAVSELNRLLAESRAGIIVSHYSLAVVQAGLGNSDAALAELESAFAERAFGMFLLKREPAFDALRGDERFTRLMRKVGLSP